MQVFSNVWEVASFDIAILRRGVVKTIVVYKDLIIFFFKKGDLVFVMIVATEKSVNKN